MTPRQVHLVRSSFALVQPVAEAAAQLFYIKLFQKDPGLRRMFRSSLEHQGHLLMHMIGATVALLDKPATLTQVLRQLGERHMGYGVREEHYATVGAALLETLAEGLGCSFCSETEAAWLEMYTQVAQTMQEGALAMAA